MSGIILHIYHREFSIVAYAKICECGIVADVECREEVIGYVELLQGDVGCNVDAGQLVVVAIELHECDIVAHIECGEGIVVAYKRCECQVLGNIERLQVALLHIECFELCQCRNVDASQCCIAREGCLDGGRVEYQRCDNKGFSSWNALVANMIAYLENKEVIEEWHP